MLREHVTQPYLNSLLKPMTFLRFLVKNYYKFTHFERRIIYFSVPSLVYCHRTGFCHFLNLRYRESNHDSKVVTQCTLLVYCHRTGFCHFLNFPYKESNHDSKQKAKHERKLNYMYFQVNVYTRYVKRTQDC